MKKLIVFLIVIFIAIKLVSCSVSTINTALETKKEIETRLEKDNEAYIERLKEGM